MELYRIAPLCIGAVQPGDFVWQNGLEAEEAFGEDRCCCRGKLSQATFIDKVRS